MYDDYRIHRATGTVPSLTSYPLKREITLADMSSETEWTKHRPVLVRIRGAGRYTKVEIEEATFSPKSRQVRVVLSAYTQITTPWYKHYAKKGQPGIRGNSTNEDKQGSSRSWHTLIDFAYGATAFGCMTDEEAEQVEEVPVIDTVTIHGRLLHLTKTNKKLCY
ncbi:unnamed protein product [Cylicocyclus nassatus]|uniref:Uncharacterized protein n=1 Tax=Cylicocyclus nassatus TaxID=53992 RepID=A0AA36M9X7_CYLNA|nr:unnamed protein product [Cylicocyclus nassatus]